MTATVRAINPAARIRERENDERLLLAIGLDRFVEALECDRAGGAISNVEATRRSEWARSYLQAAGLLVAAPAAHPAEPLQKKTPTKRERPERRIPTFAHDR